MDNKKIEINVKDLPAILSLELPQMHTIWHCNHFFLYEVKEFTITKLDNGLYKIIAHCNGEVALNIGRDFAKYYTEFLEKNG